MGAAPVHRAVPLVSQVFVVLHHGIENRGQHAPVTRAVALEPVEDELRDRGIPDELGAAQDLEVARDCGLWQVEHGLEIGHEQRRRGQAVQYAKPGRFGDREQEVSSGCSGHIRRDEYTNRRI
jgi:hypothetical protein